MSAQTSRQAIDSPTAWFAALERARLSGDTRLERLAIRQLERLGVSVTFRPPRSSKLSGTAGVVS